MPPTLPHALPPGLTLLPGHLDRAEQQSIVTALRPVIAAAPLVQPVTAWGKAMSVRMTAAGRLGWVIRAGRYGYADRHPGTGQPWPPIPRPVLAVWRAVADWPGDPDCCLINWYGPGARMGVHRDADEGDFTAPVVSISLGDPALFRLGGLGRDEPTRSFLLDSGDVLILGGPSRLIYHGIDRIHFGAGDLLPGGGRINLTLRVVTSA